MSFKCPRCQKVSHHIEDERHGYCANCHDFTAPAPGNIPNAGDTHVFVDGIVAARNHEPYVRLTVNGEKAQLGIAEAAKVATDLLRTAARTEADAMILQFFKDRGLPAEMGAQLMMEFRYFRQRQDEAEVTGTEVDPDTGLPIR